MIRVEEVRVTAIVREYNEAGELIGEIQLPLVQGPTGQRQPAQMVLYRGTHKDVWAVVDQAAEREMTRRAAQATKKARPTLVPPAQEAPTGTE